MNLVRIRKGYSKLPEGCVALWHERLRCDDYYIPITSEQIERFKFWQQQLGALPLRENEAPQVRIAIPCLVVDSVGRGDHPESAAEYNMREEEHCYKVFRSTIAALIRPDAVVLGTNGYEGFESIYPSYKLNEEGLLRSIYDDRGAEMDPDKMSGLYYDYNHDDCWPYESLLEIVDQDNTFIIHDAVIDCYEKALQMEAELIKNGGKFEDEHEKDKYERYRKFVPLYKERYGESDPFSMEAL